MYKLVRAPETFDCHPYLFGLAMWLGEHYSGNLLGDLNGFGELVSGEDARRWAAALRGILDDVPNESTRDLSTALGHGGRPAEHDANG
jgi:hypothetical protein